MKTRMLIIQLLLPFILIACDTDNGSIGGSGMIETTEVVVSAESSGQLEKLYVAKGDKIEENAVIGLIDTTTVVLRLKQAQAMYRAALVKLTSDSLNISSTKLTSELAKKEFGRVQKLIASGSVNQQQFDNAENAMRQAELMFSGARAALRATEADIARIESEIALIEKQLSDCHPRSPLTGTVVEKFIEAGELVKPGKALVKIASLDTVEVKIYLPPQDLTSIQIGGRAEVNPEDGRTEMITGTIIWISPQAEFTPKNVQTKEARADLVYAVKVKIPNSDQALKIGMPVSVSIP